MAGECYDPHVFYRRGVLNLSLAPINIIIKIIPIIIVANDLMPQLINYKYNAISLQCIKHGLPNNKNHPTHHQTNQRNRPNAQPATATLLRPHWAGGVCWVCQEENWQPDVLRFYLREVDGAVGWLNLLVFNVVFCVAGLLMGGCAFGVDGEISTGYAMNSAQSCIDGFRDM